MDEIEEMIAEEEKQVQNNIQHDPEKKQRLDSLTCKSCYYNHYFGFSAITKTNCKNCQKEMVFGSSDVDIYCKSCALKLKKCKKCGQPLD